MRLSLKHTLALAAIVWIASTARAQEIRSSPEVRSSNERFFARLRPAGAHTEVEVVDVRLKGRALWTAKGLDLSAADAWRLTDDGKTLAAIDTKGSAGRPLVHVVREGKLLASLGAEALAVPAELLGEWLSHGESVIRLRTVERDGAAAPRLDLLARDEGVRSIDLVTGAVRLPPTEPVIGPVRVDPEAGSGMELVFVSNWFAPDVVFAGEPLPVHVRGSLPTPVHQFAGFALERSGPEERRLRLSPRMHTPPPGTMAPQVLKGFDETATLSGLPPGSYTLTVEGRNPEDRPDVRDVRVLPAGPACSFQRTGGFAGVRESVVLFDDGRVVSTRSRPESRSVLLAGETERAAVARSLARLPRAPVKRAKSPGADLFSYELVWTVEGRPIRVERDDGNLEPELREWIAALEALTAPSRRARYSIDLAKSMIEVRTGSSGLLSAFGHEHRLMVRRLSGTVEVDLADLANASVVLTIDAGSLAVVDDDSEKDRAEIEKEMNEHVLEVAAHPTIEFKSREITATPTVDGAFDVVAKGILSLHGKERETAVAGRLEIRDGSLRVRGSISLLQSWFGIQPTSAVGGTVKVADKVRISFDVTAVREAPLERR